MDEKDNIVKFPKEMVFTNSYVNQLLVSVLQAPEVNYSFQSFIRLVIIKVLERDLDE